MKEVIWCVVVAAIAAWALRLIWLQYQQPAQMVVSVTKLRERSIDSALALLCAIEALGILMAGLLAGQAAFEGVDAPSFVLFLFSLGILGIARLAWVALRAGTCMILRSNTTTQTGFRSGTTH